MGKLFYDYYDHQIGVYHTIKKRFKFIALGLISALLLLMAISHVSAATVINITPSNLNGWTPGTTTGGTVTFEPNGTAPTGTGVLRLTTTSDNDSRANISLPVSKNLSEVDEMSMDSRQIAAARPEINASYRVTIDADGNLLTTNDKATLIYEPYWHDGAGDSAPIVADTWQTWDAKAGKFWASISNGNSVPGLTHGGGGPPLYTIEEVLASNPNALVTNVSIGLGSYNPSSDILVDDFTFDDAIYNFEPDPALPPEAPTNLHFTQGAKTLSCDAITGASGIYSTHLLWTLPDGQIQTEWKVTPTYPSGSHGTPYSWTSGTDAWIGANIGQGYGAPPNDQGTYAYSVQYKGSNGLWSDPATCNLIYDTTKPVISISPEAPKLISGVQNFTVTITDDNLDPDENKQIWVELYGDPDWSQKKGQKVDLSSGTGIFTIDTNDLADGKYVLRVGSVVDAAGNTSGDKSFKHFTIDNTPPSKPQMLGFYKGHNSNPDNFIPCGGFTNSTQVRIDWEDSPESDIDYYWFGTKFNQKHAKVSANSHYDGNMTPGNNPYHYTVIAVDKAGNESEISDQCGLILDQVAPIVTVTPLPEDRILSGTVTFDITITDDYLDPNKLKNIWVYLYKVDGNQEQKGAKVDLSSGTGSFTVNTKDLPDGKFNLNVAKLYDAAGNPSGEKDNYFRGYIIDNTAPDVSNVILNGKSVNIARDDNCGPTDFNLISGKVDLSATITDNSSGVKSAQYKIRKVTNGGCTQAGIYNSGNVNMNNQSDDLWVTLPGTELDTNEVPADGNYTIMMTIKDNLDNTTTKYIDITVDNTAPDQPEANPPAGIYTGPQDIELSSNDATSGLDKIYYTLDGSEPSDTSGIEYSGPITITEDTTLKAIAYDNAGNASSVLTAEYGIAPIISNESSTSTTTTSVTIEWTTDKPATSRVIYDTTSHDPLSSPPNYGYAFSTTEDSNKVTSHSVTVTGLTPGTTYYFRTVSHGSPESVSGEIVASTNTPSQSTSSNNNFSSSSNNGNNTFASAANTTPFNTFGTFGTTVPSPAGTGNVLNAANDNDGNSGETDGEVQADSAGVSSATTAETAAAAGNSIWSWWWILPIIAALLILFGVLRRRSEEE